MSQQDPAPARRSPGRFGTLVTALLAGVAGGLLAPLILPRLERGIRPATKGMFKAGIALYERGRETAAELGEMAGDMLAEARAEYDAERAPSGTDGEPLAEKEVVRLRGTRGKELGSPNA